MFLWEKIQNNPVLVASAIRMSILCAITFGLDWTLEQVTSVMLAVESILALLTRDAVTPNLRVQEKVEQRIAHRELAGTTGTGNGLTPPTSNTRPTSSGMAMIFALCLVTMVGCGSKAQRATTLVNVEDAVTQSLVKVQDTANVLCSAQTPILPVAPCKQLGAASGSALRAAATYNRFLKCEASKGEGCGNRFEMLAQIVRAINDLITTVQQVVIMPPNDKVSPETKAALESDLRSALGAAAGGGK